MKIAPRPEDVPKSSGKPKGMLRIGPEQVAQLKAIELHRSRIRVVDYLTEVSPEAMAGRPRQEKFAKVMAYEAEGEKLGLRSERAQMKWAYLMAATDGEIAQIHYESVLQ